MRCGYKLRRIFVYYYIKNEPTRISRLLPSVRDLKGGGEAGLDLLLRVINKETSQEDFADIVDEYSTSVYRFCRGLTYSKEDAEDLFQETFLKILEQPNKINASENPKSLLFSTCTYIWKGWKRKYARRSRLAPVGTLDESATDGCSLEENYMEQEENRIVRALVDALPEKFKIPTILYYTAEISVSDIALSLDIPVGTVKSRLYKARKIIEKGLMEYE